ncbi:hypothetical protein A9R16_002045 [Acidiferrobacter thiooxydans]|uniref:hypothetical protein n=1 Tax=Acidiferrobacter thiooxydans TaxID=163359 RepID=UPI00159EF664|nr:hypothetical protein A9R16_002045 [Acidiferrobacter thiooxydans]
MLTVPGAHRHVYGKGPRPRRTLGHATRGADHEARLFRALTQLRSRERCGLHTPGRWGAGTESCLA